jgi:hypothetical protein
LKRILTIAILLFLSGILTQSLTAQTGVSSLFPDSGEIQGWQRDGEIAVAIDEGSLASLINGAAPFYVAHGTMEAGFQDYLQSETYLTLEIYKTRDEDAAAKLYDEIYVEEPEPLELTAAQGRMLTNLPGVLVFELRQGRYFVRETLADKSEAAYETLLSFARLVSNKIAGQNDVKTNE